MPEPAKSTTSRASRAARALRDRVAGEVHVTTRLADLDSQVKTLTREVAELRKTVRALQQTGASPATAVRKGPVKQRQPERIEKLIAAVDAEHLSYLGPNNLRTLAWAVARLDTDGVAGSIIEAGTALGGSAIVMSAAKSPDRPLLAHDVFGMIPPPGEQDGEDVHERYETIKAGGSQGLAGEQYYGYRDDLIGEVTASFARHGVPVGENGVRLVQGLFEDTLSIDSPVALAHLDGDWYDSTMVCLTRIVPHLSKGGRLVIDDYDSWSGCRTAIDEFFANRPGFAYERRGRLHIVKL